jgi:hypothetical protein
MTDHRHLTEEERQGAADGTLDADRQRVVDHHLASCDACAADVASLRTLMTRIRTSPDPASHDLDELWPSIRSRIEESKVVSLDQPDPSPDTHRRRLRPLWLAGALVAAVAIIVVSLPPLPRSVTRPSPPTSAPPTGSDMLDVADSTRAYEAEAQELLNQLQLQRAMMPPRTSASVDHDLAVIDSAIAELKEAIVRDPNNPALRRLLASSYRQKVELLKRVNGAG